MQGNISNIRFRFLSSISSLIMLICLILTPSCTQPGGHIGPYFGTWQLMEVQHDGVPDQTYTWPLMLSFQGDLFDMAQADGPEIIGYWEERNGELTLDGAHNYGTFPAVTGFPSTGIVTLKIESMTGKHMILSRIGDEGAESTFYFKKII